MRMSDACAIFSSQLYAQKWIHSTLKALLTRPLKLEIFAHSNETRKTRQRVEQPLFWSGKAIMVVVVAVGRRGRRKGCPHSLKPRQLFARNV